MYDDVTSPTTIAPAGSRPPDQHLHNPATFDGQRGAGDRGGGVRAQERGQLAELLPTVTNLRVGWACSSTSRITCSSVSPRALAVSGICFGKGCSVAGVCTTVSDKATPSPLCHVNRRFRAPRPNMLWVPDFTYDTPAACRGRP